MKTIFLTTLAFLTLAIFSYAQLPQHTTKGWSMKQSYYVYSTYEYLSDGAHPNIVDDKSNKITLIYLDSKDPEYEHGTYTMENFLGIPKQTGQFTKTNNILILSTTDGKTYFWVFEIDTQESDTQTLAMLLLPFNKDTQKFRVKLFQLTE